MASREKVREDDKRGARPGTVGVQPFVATDEQRRDVLAWVKAGLTQQDCADLLDISKTTFQRHFNREWKIERIRVKLAIASRLTTMALKGDKTCMIFWLRSQAKWNTRIEHVGEGGGPIRLIDISPYLGKLEDGQLDLLEPLLEQILTQGGAGLDFRDQIGAGADQGGASEA